jgi:hypothetical protein
VFTVINTGADTTNQVVLTGSAGEIHFKETNGATLTNTLATQKVGDFVTLATVHGSSKYSVVAVQGVWAIS